MLIQDVKWTMQVNVLQIQCDCGVLLWHPSNYSLVVCPLCGRRQLWHHIDPKPLEGPWSLPEMASNI